MFYAADFRQKAREGLKGSWGLAVGVGLLASLLGGTTASSGGSVSTGDSTGIESIAELDGIIPTEYQVAVLAVISLIGFTATVFALIHFIIGGAVTLGYAKFNLNLVDQRSASLADLFSEFHRFGEAFFLQLKRGIYVFLWTLLFIIPGIYAAYGYAMSHYILLENPDMTSGEAMSASKELMEGNRWRLFCLECSFIGWNLLSVLLTLGIGHFWLVPYMEASYAAFYREIKAEKYGREEKKEDPYEGFYSSSTF